MFSTFTLRERAPSAEPSERGSRRHLRALTDPIVPLAAPRPKRCPCCDAQPSAWLPIRYGMVAQSVIEQARRGEVHLGSVNYGRNEPRSHCTRCGTDFDRARPELDRFGQPLAAPAPPPPPPAVVLWTAGPSPEVAEPLGLRTALARGEHVRAA